MESRDTDSTDLSAQRSADGSLLFVEDARSAVLEPEVVAELANDPEDSEQKGLAALTITIQSWATPVVGLVMLVLGLLAGYYGRPMLASEDPVAAGASVATAGTDSSSAASRVSDPDRAAVMEALLPRVRHFRGDPEAPITMIEFSDFQCPYCGRFATGAGRQIEEQYVAAGQVRFGYVHFAFLGPESQLAGEASECAADQNAFWEYHDYIFTQQDGESRGALDRDRLTSFAADLGLDTASFSECLESGKYADLVLEETSWGRSLGVQSTPTFVINGQTVIGAQPFEVFERVFAGMIAE